MSSIFLIAANTFRESIRDKILYNIVFLAIGLAVFSIILGEWSVFDKAHVIKSITISIMSLSGLLIAVFVGISLVQKEIQRRTVYALLSKPIHRSAFILGKYLGLLGTLAVHLSLLTTLFYFILWATNSQPEWGLLRSVYLVFWEMALVVAIAMLFSSFSTPVLSSLLTLGVYAAGHLSNQILEQIRFVRKVGESAFIAQNYGIVEGVATWVHRILPGLYRFNITHQVLHHLELPPLYLLWTSLYAIGYIGVLLSIATWWFGRRDFL